MFLKQNLITYSLYVITTFVVISLMDEPTQSILIWPGVGVGVICAMVWGYRVIFAIYLAELSIGFLFFSNGSDPYIFKEFGINNIFALFRCYFGAYLFKYVIGYPNAMISYKPILKFVLLVAPIATLISTTAFDVTRFLLGFVETLTLSNRFFDWWLGDYLGFLIFAPLTIILIGQPKSIWKPRVLTVGLPVIFTLFSVIFIYNKSHNNQIQKVTENLQVKKEIFSDRLNQYNYWIDDLTSGVLTHFLPKGNNKDEINSYLESLVSEDYNKFNAIIWINEGIRKDFITSKSINQKALNKIKFFDFKSLLKEKIKSKQQLSPTQYIPELNLFVSVFRFQKEGYTTYIIVAHNFIEYSHKLIDKYNMQNIKILLNINNKTMYLVNSKQKLPRDPIVLTSDIKFYNEIWQLVLKPSIKYFIQHQTGTNPDIAKLSLLFTGLIGVMLLIITGKTTLTSIQVHERTLELEIQRKNLTKSKKQYQDLIEQHPVVLWRRYIVENRMAYISNKVKRLYGYSSDDWLNKENFWINQIHVDDQESVKTTINQALKNNTTFELAYRLIKEDGEIAWINDVVNISEDESLNKQLIGLMIDVTEIQEAKKRQGISERKYRTLFKHAVDPLLIIDLDDNSIRDSNDKAAFLFGLNNISGYVSLADFSLIKQPDGCNSRKKLREIYQQLENEKSVKFEWYMLSKEHREIICKIELVKLPEQDYNIMLANINDITEKKLHDNKINQLAYYDNLTKLPNREYFYSKFEYFHELAQEQKLFGTLIFLDLDRFKILNDSLGHQAGDELLKMVAARIRGVGKKNCFCARLGGDEFIIMTKKLGESIESTLETSLVKSELILEALNEPYQLGDYEHYITPSIGISLFPSGSATPDQIIHQADIAMYASKEKGKNTITIYHDKMVKLVGKKLIVEKAVRQALDKNEFKLYYQPQMNINNEIFSVEALLRWDRSSELNINTENLIDTVEQIGLTHELGYWVFDQACSQLEKWQKQGHTIKSMAINVSAKQFHQVLFIEKIKSVIQSYDIKPSQITLELTEGVIIEDIAVLIDKLNELKDYGIRTSLDDFGTGYSSLAYLKHLPIDQLKIDKMFIHDLAPNPSTQHIVYMIIELARSMDIELIAEGIETQEQSEILKSLGCTNFQGFYFSEAKSADQIFKA